MQIRQPRLAEIVAARLRKDILTGRLRDGDMLPNQETLFQQFSVSLPALREAMRILETEGLITVRRGNVGGAVVHMPTSDRVADMIAMVLQTRNASEADVSMALRHLEPICAALCAGRPDREEAVVPALREIVERQRGAIVDGSDFLADAERFHGRIISLCGNEPMIVVIGSLQAIWSSHSVQVWETFADSIDPQLDPASPMAAATRRAATRAHERLVDAIEAGNASKASSLAVAHLEAAHDAALRSSPNQTINADLVSSR
jgi:DNA-binding FadR family transcriptional regulator